ncbi:MAG: hypothetical protein ACJ749_16260 [Flavisolibacter sp.]
MNSFRQSVMEVPAALIALVFLLIIFSLNWLGYRTRKRISKKNPDKDVTLGTAEGSLMGLMALLLAFSFGMATTKYESRRQTIVDEANLLNTAILRSDLYFDSARQPIRYDLKSYLESRINYYNAGDNPSKIQMALSEGNKCFASLWKKNVMLANDQTNRGRAEQMAPVLISMKNMMITREAGRVATVPALIISVLLILVFVASFISGYGVKPGNRNILLSIAFALMTSVVLYLVMELGRPRQGYINLQNAEQKIEDLRTMFP